MATRLMMYRGDTVSFNFAAKQANGSPLDISTGSLKFTVKSNTRQADVDAIVQKDTDDNGVVVTSGPSGLATVLLTPPDTSGIYAPAELLWDFQYTTSGGLVFTLADGTLLVRADVTRT